jgi:hypothetical protein
MRTTRKQVFPMKKMILLILLGCLAFTTYGQPSSEENVGDSGDLEGTEEPVVSQNDKEEIERQATLAKEERKREARKKKRTMESCLTLVRSFYSAQQQMITDFMDEHPTNDKSRLLSKILAQMMIKCNGVINNAQIAELQGFKATPNDFNYKKDGFMPMIELDWETLRYQSPNEEPVEGEGTGPVDMSPQEILMSNEVEEYSDEMKRETDAETRASMGKTSVAFFDIENMSGAAQAFYMIAFFGLLGGVAYLGYKELVEKEPDFNAVRREMVNLKKQAKKDSKNKKKNE